MGKSRGGGEARHTSPDTPKSRLPPTPSKRGLNRVCPRETHHYGANASNGEYGAYANY